MSAEPEKKDLVERAIDHCKPIIANLSFGGVMGYCSGAAMKKIGQTVAVIVGVGFILLQTAVSAGYITVDWGKVRDSAVKKMDVNKDGKVNVEDVKEYWKILRHMLTNKIPAAGGFSFGFLYGVKNG